MFILSPNNTERKKAKSGFTLGFETLLKIKCFLFIDYFVSYRKTRRLVKFECFIWILSSFSVIDIYIKECKEIIKSHPEENHDKDSCQLLNSSKLILFHILEKRILCNVCTTIYYQIILQSRQSCFANVNITLLIYFSFLFARMMIIFKIEKDKKGMS